MGKTIGKASWRAASLALLVGAMLSAALALTACGAPQPSSSSASPSSGASSPSASSAGAGSTELAAVYLPEKIVTTFHDGTVQTSTSEFDEQGRQKSDTVEFNSADMTAKIVDTYSDWDEYGHARKGAETVDISGADSYAITMDFVEIDTDQDGFTTGNKVEMTIDKEQPFAEGKPATETRAQSAVYGKDASVLAKTETVIEDRSKDGNLLGTASRTCAHDENGLQTSFTEDIVKADGSKTNQSVKLEWTKGADGKPVSFKATMEMDGKTKIMTADVTLNEQGLIEKIGNFAIDGEPQDTTAEITYKKIDKPLQNAFEGWKSFDITNAIIPLL